MWYPQGTNVSHLRGKENHLQKCFGKGYVGSLEGMCFFLTGQYFWEVESPFQWTSSVLVGVFCWVNIWLLKSDAACEDGCFFWIFGWILRKHCDSWWWSMLICLVDLERQLWVDYLFILKIQMFWIGFLSYLFDHITIVTRENTKQFQRCSFGSTNPMGKTNSVIWFRLFYSISIFSSWKVYILYTNAVYLYIYIYTYPQWRSLKKRSLLGTGSLWRTWAHTYITCIHT